MDSKVWGYMQEFYVTFGPFTTEQKAKKFAKVNTFDDKPTSLHDYNRPRIKDQLCVCGALVRVHKKPTLVLHLSNLCRSLENCKLDP